VTSASAEVLYTAPREETTVVSPAVAYLVTHLLEQVIENGTGRGARAAGLRGAAAGKTGTTDDTRDAWFVGYTPEVIAGVWVGHDDNQPTGLSGAQGALPIWTQFVRAVGESDEEAFAEPEGIVWREVDPESGQLAGPDCPDRREEPFLAETAPQEACTMHRSFWTAFDVRGPEGDVPRGQRRDTSGRAVGEFLRRLFTFDW
jgi:membrane carboxypeptidase/penicillin-binding protein